MMITDTHPEIDRIQMDLLRKAGPVHRANLMRSLTSSVITMSRRAIARRHPEFDEEQINLKFIEIHYGRELAKGVQEFVRARS